MSARTVSLPLGLLTSTRWAGLSLAAKAVLLDAVSLAAQDYNDCPVRVGMVVRLTHRRSRACVSARVFRAARKELVRVGFLARVGEPWPARDYYYVDLGE